MKNRPLDEIVKEASRLTAPYFIQDVNLTLEECLTGAYATLWSAHLFPEVPPKPTKWSSGSDCFRALGNKVFTSSKNDIEALELYSKAVATANMNEEQLYLAYANRSAVTFALQEYDDAIKDINRALAGNYPTHLKYKLLERRGKCFKALSDNQKALKDFNEVKALILDSKLSEDKVSALSCKIDSLIEECSLENVNLVPKMLVEDFTLSFSASDYIQCASSALDIKYSVEMGRHVVATRDIYPGDVIAIEKPYISVLLPSSYYLFCDYCKKRCHSSVPCTSCTKVVFCNEDCRERSLSSYHSIECDLLPSLLSVGCDKMELLAVRVLLVASECGKDLNSFSKLFCNSSNSNGDLKGFVGNKYLSDDYCSTHCLETNEDLRNPLDVFQRCVIAVVITYLLQVTTSLFFTHNLEARESHCKTEFELTMLVSKWILRYLMSAACNAHEIAEMRVCMVDGSISPESTEIGGAIYPFHSLINHSCDPNVVRHAFRGDTVALSCIKFISKGEQIFDNYGYHHAIHSLKTRQDHLKFQYFFTCCCIACVNDWPMLEDIPEAEPKLLTSGNEKVVQESSNEYQRVFSDIKSGRTSDDGLRFLFQHLTTLHQNVKLPWREYNLCQEAIKHCLSMKANHYIYK